MTFKRVRTHHYIRWDGTRLIGQSFIASVKSWPVDTILKATVDKYVEHKTVRQNSYLHVLFDIAARDMNRDMAGSGSQWTPETIKQYCKDQHLYPVVDMVGPGGVIVQVTLDTHQLNIEQTAATIDRVIMHFADEWHIILPEPRKQQSMKL